MKKIDFVFFTEANFRLIEPLVNHLPGCDVRVLPGLDFERLRQGESPWAPSNVPIGQMVPLRWTTDTDPQPLEINSSKGRDGVFVQWFNTHQEFKLAELLEHIEVRFRAELERTQPDLVVLPEETDYCRGLLASLVLNAFPKIPRAVLFPHYYHMFKDYPLTREPLAQSYVVATREMQTALIASGIPGSKITRVGFPQVGECAKGPRSRAVLFLMQNLPFEERILADVIRGTAACGFKLWVKCHPMRERETQDLFARLPKAAHVQRVPADVGVAELAKKVCWVVGQSSSGFFDSLMVGTPVLVAHYQMGPYPLRLVPDGEWVQVFSGEGSLLSILERSCELKGPSPVSGMAIDEYRDRIVQAWFSIGVQ